LGSSNLAIQYWEIYCIVNEKNKTLAELWDGLSLKCTFHRCVDIRLCNMWEQVVSLVSTISLGEEDELVCQFSSSGFTLFIVSLILEVFQFISQSCGS
jgi:hypothetical protein